MSVFLRLNEYDSQQEIIEKAKGCDLHERHLGETLLHYAVRSDMLALAEWLLDQGCDVNAQDDKGRTPLYLAALRSDYTMICLMRSRGAKDIKNAWGLLPVHQIVLRNSYFLLHLFFDTIDEPSPWGTPLQIAAKISCLESRRRCVTSLVRMGANVDLVYEGQSALDIAIQVEDFVVAQILVDAGASTLVDPRKELVQMGLPCDDSRQRKMPLLSCMK